MINNIISFIKQYDIKNVKEKFLKLSDEIEGMSGAGLMEVLNSSVSLMDKDSLYLEVGTWKGKTLTSAALDNPQKCVAIDNFSQPFERSPQDVKINLHKNILKYKNRTNIQFIEGDYQEIFKTDFIPEKSVEVYFYDGHHAEEHQYLGIKKALKFLKDDSIVFVDDSAGGSRVDVFNANERLKKDGINLEVLRHFESPEGKYGFWQGLLAMRYNR